MSIKSFIYEVLAVLVIAAPTTLAAPADTSQPDPLLQFLDTSKLKATEFSKTPKTKVQIEAFMKNLTKERNDLIKRMLPIITKENIDALSKRFPEKAKDGAKPGATTSEETPVKPAPSTGNTKVRSDTPRSLEFESGN